MAAPSGERANTSRFWSTQPCSWPRSSFRPACCWTYQPADRHHVRTQTLKLHPCSIRSRDDSAAPLPTDEVVHPHTPTNNILVAIAFATAKGTVPSDHRLLGPIACDCGPSRQFAADHHEQVVTLVASRYALKRDAELGRQEMRSDRAKPSPDTFTAKHDFWRPAHLLDVDCCLAWQPILI